MEKQPYHIQKGSLLIAEPFMMDPNFKRAVLLMCEHIPDEGSLAFIINKPLNLKLADVLPDFPEFDVQVYFGGPVEKETSLHYLHNVGDLLEGSIKVADGVWRGGDFSQLKFLVENQLIIPENIRFYLGYSGWESGQLDEEMEDRSWIIAESDPNYVFNRKPKELWNLVLQHMGDQYSIISEMPDTVRWN